MMLKLVEVGNHELVHWSDLSGGQSSMQVGKFYNLVWFYF